MALPDTLERVGVVVGSVVMLGIPLGILGFVLFPPDDNPVWMAAVVQLVPAVAVGLLVAYERLPLRYAEVWRFGIAFWVVAAGLGVGVGVNVTGGGTGAALRVWLLAVAIAAVLATYRRWLPGARDQPT